MDGRQFIDKRIIFNIDQDPLENVKYQINFQNRSAVYIYCTGVPDEKAKEIEKKFKSADVKSNHTTGKTILSLQKITYDKDTGANVKLSVFNQVDAGLNFMLVKMAAGVMPKMTQQWFQELSKYVLAHQSDSATIGNSKTMNPSQIDKIDPELQKFMT